MDKRLKHFYVVGTIYIVLVFGFVFVMGCESRMEVSCGVQSFSGPKIEYRKYGHFSDEERKQMIDFCSKQQAPK